MIFFYQPEIDRGKLFLEDEEYQHCVRVLRKKAGDEIGLLDGKGGKYHARISEVTGQSCRFEITESLKISTKPFYNHIAIAPTKNVDRIEWFVEKASELGADEITFLITRNAERNKLRIDRMEKKAVSALKQSRSGHLTRVNPLMPLEKLLKTDLEAFSKFIAVATEGLPYLGREVKSGNQVLTLIGPEGDFSSDEIHAATSAGFQPVSLGHNILRTETAGIIACQLVNSANTY